MKKPEVILLGDSISLGYREHVRGMLINSVSVRFPKEQGKGIADIFRMLYEWNRDLIEDPDNVKMVYWNAGLWDVVEIFGDKENTPIDIYMDYAQRILLRMKKMFPKAKICFASTTPVVQDRYGNDFKRSNEKICRYNKLIFEFSQNYDVFYDDLYSLLSDASMDDFADATHFGENINRKIAKHICEVIHKKLENEIVEYEKYRVKMDEYKENFLQSITKGVKLPIVTWGAGNIFYEFEKIISDYCTILAVIDKDYRIQGSRILGHLCISQEDMPYDIKAVVITVDGMAATDIQDYCYNKGIVCCSYKELLDYIWPIFEEEALANAKPTFIDADPAEEPVMTKYLGINISENTCNLDCTYCYLQANPYRRFSNLRMKNPHIARFIRWRLSKDVLGGSCLIGITGSGETFFAEGLEEVCVELLKEGHYLHIVTNGILTTKIERLIKKAGKYSKNIIFKLSFHYMELMKRGIIGQFVSTVELIKNSPASYTIELMPHDELVPYIDDVIKFSREHFDALPQLTIARKSDTDSKLLTNMTFSEYKQTYDIFDSEMFETRMRLYPQKGKNCKAGEKSLFIDLYTGHINRCLFHEEIGNLYYDGIDNLHIPPVGDLCGLGYCFNCHVYATLGVVPNKDVPTYATIRDRKMSNGKHWIKEDMRRFLDIKL